MMQDLRYALRGLRLRPGFAIAVVATLALGIGANATMFGIVDRLLFRAPQYLVAPERSHHLYFTRVVRGAQQLGEAFPYQRFLDLSASSRTMEVLAAYAQRPLAVGPAETARETLVGAASASLWQLFDARPAIGRFFTADEDRDPSGARVAVLSYAYWQSQYAGSPNVLGTTIVITPTRYTVIGVAPRGFTGVERETPSVFIPIVPAAMDEFGTMWTAERTGYALNWLQLYGRRKGGISLDAATADLSAAFRASFALGVAAYPGLMAAIEIAKPRMVLSSMLVERGPRPSADARVATWLFGVTGIVLLIACANVGNLMLARSLSRRREIAVRIALGVSRSRLVRQSLIESGVLAALGAVAGLMLAEWGGRLLRAFLLPGVEWQSAVSDPRTLLFAGVCATVAALTAGVLPVLQASRGDVIAALKTGARAGHAGRSPLRTTLMLTQVTLSVVLLIGAGLFVRSVQRVAGVRMGYDADRLLVVDPRLRSTILDSAQQRALWRALIERASGYPGVENVTLACSVPFTGTCTARIFVAGMDSTNHLGEFVWQTASPTYFATTGTRVLRGRGITVNDRAGTPLVALVSESMSRALWPGRDPIGQCIRARLATAPCRTVIGVAENVRQERIGDEGGFEFYIPAAQEGEHRARLLVRVRGEPAAHVEGLRRELAPAMPASAYLVIRPLSSVVSNATRSWRLGATMFAAFGALALVLAAIGLYSVVAYGVAQRRHEVGVRIALGARAGSVVALVVRDGLRVVGVGVAIGLGLALVGGRWLRPLLFQVSPHDPWVFILAALVLVGVAFAASSVPAFKAARVDPVTALRSD